ncbi:MAG TPA: TIM barrel protein [Planctomycetota bacterium]|nr:TIM barrel protein [Planctomycetota bacterium]
MAKKSGKEALSSAGPVTFGGFKVCFTSAAAPQWSADELVRAAVKHGYAGVELVAGAGGKHGAELGIKPDKLRSIREVFSSSGVGIACLATPVSFHAADPAARAAALKDLEQYVKIAEDLASPFVRVFGGDIPPEVEVAGAADYISDALADAAAFVEQSTTCLLVETFGTFRNSRFLREIIKQVYSPKLQALWNVPETVRGLEPVADTFDSLCDQIRHVHLADYEYFEERTAVAPAIFGQGFVPVAQAIEVLRAGDYKGYLAFDPAEIPEDSDVAVAEAMNLLKGMLEG